MVGSGVHTMLSHWLNGVTQNAAGISDADVELYDDVHLCCDIYDWMQRLLSVVMDTARHVGELRIVIACDISDETLDINHIKLQLCGTVSDTLCVWDETTATMETMFCSCRSQSVEQPSSWTVWQADISFQWSKRLLMTVSSGAEITAHCDPLTVKSCTS